MRRSSDVLLRSLATALLFVAVAAGVSLTLAPWMRADEPVMPFVLAIALAAFFVHASAALISTAFSLLLLDWFFLPPLHSLRVSNGGDAIRLGLLAAFGILASVGSWLYSRLTEQMRRKEQSLRESEQLFRSLAENARVIIGIVQSRRFVYVNPYLAEISGYSRDELLSMDITRLIHPAYRELIAERARRRQRGEDVAPHYQFAMVTQAGDTRWLDFSPAPAQYQGKPAVIGVAYDITELRQAEAAIRENEERLRLAVESADLGTWDFNAATGEVTWSPRAKTMFGLPPDAHVTYPIFLSLIHPDDRDRVEQHMLQATGPGGSEDYDIDFRIVRPDGAVRWIVGKGRVFFEGYDGKKRATRVIGTSMDVTDQKEAEAAVRLSEERLRLAAEAAQIGTWDWNLMTDRMVWDPRGSALLGQPAGQPEWHHEYVKLVHPDDLRRMVEAKDRAIQEREEFLHEYRVLRPDDGIRWMLVHGRGVYDDRGRPVRMVGVLMDVTSRREYEDRLREEKDSAEGANRAKDQFLATLSHELRTPLTPVLIGAEALARDETLPHDVREELRMMGQNVSVEAKLIDDLLDLTRIARGKLRLTCEQIEIHGLLRRAAETCRADLSQKGLTLETRLEAAQTAGWGDSARLQQVFWNILKNAIKFTPEGGRIGIRTWNVPRPTEAAGAIAVPTCERSPRVADTDLYIQIWDTGVGIEPSQLVSIFNAFEQGGRQVTQQFGGLGLGLAISKAIVELHGGHIEAHSKGKGMGAQFTIRLPSIVALPPQPEPVGEARTPGRRSLRILLVEDHESTARVLAALLRSFEHHVDVAGTMREAMALSAEHQFDLIVSDLGLPDRSGLDLMRQLRQRTHIAGIALSGYGMEDDVRRSRDAGFAKHLIKPVNLKQLEEAIAQAMA